MNTSRGSSIPREFCNEKWVAITGAAIPTHFADRAPSLVTRSHT